MAHVYLLPEVEERVAVGVIPSYDFGKSYVNLTNTCSGCINTKEISGITSLPTGKCITIVGIAFF